MKCKPLYFFLGALMIGFFFTGCKSVEKIVAVEAEKRNMSEIVRKKVNIDNYPDHYLMENGDLIIKGKNRSNAKMTFYIQKNKQIFSSVKFMGFEIMRIKISKDSVKYINRINREYMFSSFDEFELNKGLPGDFSALQNLILTGIYFDHDQNERELINRFVKEEGGYRITNVPEEGRKIEMIYSADHIKMTKIYISDYVLDILSEFDFIREDNNLNLIEGLILTDNINLELQLNLSKIVHEPYFKTDFTLGKNYKEIGFKL